LFVVSHFLTGVFNTEAHPFKAPPAKATYVAAVHASTLQKNAKTGAATSTAATPNVSPIPKLPSGLKQLSALFSGF
jgi:mannosyl-oligosaccharide alpha-1,2-mannosidase